jgi:ABC-type spermidine/putrescine transport system permease subunit II
VPVARLLGGYSALVYAFLFMPILVVVVYAFNSGTNVAEFSGFSTKWFGRALDDDTITSAVGRSVRIAVSSAIVATVFGTAAALAMSKVSRRVRNPFDVLVFLTLVVPEIVIAVSTLIFFVNLSFDLGPVTMFLGHTVFNASLVMLIVRARFVSMGYSLEEASMDLGASRIGTFRQVTLPRLAPAIVAGLLLSFTFSFDDVVISNFTAGAGNDTWPLRVLAGLRFGLRPDLNATATMMLAVTLVGLTAVALVLRRAARTQGVSPDVIAAGA